jgi:Flp pilus assembly CpaF family ATPase
MDPDRVIVGEVRGDEVLPMLNAMSQGNEGSMCTIHADSSAGAFQKLAMYALQTPQQLPIEATNLLVATSIDFVVFLSQARDGTRFVSSVREVAGADGRLLLSNEVLRPGPDGRAVSSGVPLTQDSAAALGAAGFDATSLRAGWSS